MKVTGIVLIVLGIVALIYGGITYTTHKKVLDVGPIQAEKKETHNIPLPPVLGVVAIVGGGALLLVGGKAREITVKSFFLCEVRNLLIPQYSRRDRQ